jgi:tetratricopeptide (TPR) repeat protein
MIEPDANRYQSFAASSTDQQDPENREGQFRPPYKVYSVRSIVLATVLGSPIAGGILMAINYKRLRRPAAAVHSVVWTVVFTTAIIAVGMILPDNLHIPNASFVVPQIFAMYGLAKSLQGPAIEAHQRLGGSLASAWGAAGIGVLIAVLVLGAIFGIALLQPNEAESVDAANNELQKGISFFDKQDYDAAIRSFTEVIRLAPKFAGAYNNRGIAYRQKGEHGKAIADYSEAIRLDPENGEVYNNRGIAYRIIGEHDKAIADFTEAIQLNPDCASAYFGRGHAYSQKGEKAKAEEDFAQAKKLGNKKK